MQVHRDISLKRTTAGIVYSGILNHNKCHMTAVTMKLGSCRQEVPYMEDIEARAYSSMAYM